MTCKKLIDDVIIGGRMKVILIFVIIVIFINPLFAQNNQITPSNFEWMAKTSINIMETYKFYSDLIESENPKFLFDARTVGSFGKNFIIPTTLGDLSVSPIQGDMAIYWKWQRKDSLSFAFLVFANSIDLQIDEDLHPELTSADSIYGDLYGWVSRKFIIAVHPKFNKDIDITIGVLVNSTPYVITDSLNNKLFSIYFDEERDEWREDEDQDELFLNGTAYGYKISTLYELKENSISLFEIDKELKNKRYGEFELGLYYYKHSKTVQTGFQYKNDKLINSLPLKFDFFWDIHKKDQWNELSYTQLDMTFFILRNKNIVESTSKKKDFYISLNWCSSYSKCVFDEALLGYSWKLSFENIWSRFGLAFGGSYNDYQYLYRMPIKNKMLAMLDFRYMW